MVCPPMRPLTSRPVLPLLVGRLPISGLVRFCGVTAAAKASIAGDHGYPGGELLGAVALICGFTWWCSGVNSKPAPVRAS